MIRTLGAALAALTLAAAPASAETPEPPVAAVVRHEAGAWMLDLTLDRDAPLWVFGDSEPLTDGRGWRLHQWTVETPGARLETVGGRDVLRGVDGAPVPRRIRVRMQPRFVDLQANYDPVLMFSNGAAAWYSEVFHLIPLAAEADLAALPRDLGPVVDGSGPARVTWSDADGPVLVQGRRLDAPESTRVGTYILFGPAELVAGEGLSTVVDPGLPGWIADELADWAPRIGEQYAARLGPGESAAPTVMMSWTGPTPGKASMAGSVLPGLVVMAFEGEGVLQPSAGVRDMARWFIGHESAHFWLGQTVRYATPEDSWITEGGADLMAIRAMQAIDPAFDVRGRLQEAVDECVDFADQPVSTSVDRGEFKAHYACGAVFALVAEAAQRRATGGDWFDFLRPLIDASREDEVLTRAEWLDRLDAVSDDPSLRADMETLLDRGTEDAAGVISGLLERAGVLTAAEEGRLRLT
ncbi:MAG: hypothetical protein H2038_05940 [Brevundimonas sp.]|uniref:hypothetical protein n=1 Tax=Brevundimonas sp. TaxID=1871086 RepID=UPI0017907A62|nr:hypothetical protein [Brevundimonas sp.]MBA4804175.1 hypothetical protein [Brevundimonas sp.]